MLLQTAKFYSFFSLGECYSTEYIYTHICCWTLSRFHIFYMHIFKISNCKWSTPLQIIDGSSSSRSHNYVFLSFFLFFLISHLYLMACESHFLQFSVPQAGFFPIFGMLTISKLSTLKNTLSFYSTIMFKIYLPFEVFTTSPIILYHFVLCFHNIWYTSFIKSYYQFLTT